MAVWDEGEGRERPGDDEVGFFADRDRTELVAHTHSVCRIDCAGVEGLFRSQAHAYASESHDEAHVSARTRTWVVVRCQSYRKSGFDIAFGVSEWYSQKERAAREHRRHGSASSECFDFCIRGLFQVVDGQRSVPDTYLDSSRDSKLIGVDLRGYTVFCSLFKDPCGFFNGEESLVAEYIDEVGEAFCGNSRQHLVADKVNIFALATPVGASDGVSAEEICPYSDRSGFLYATDYAKHLKLIFHGQTIAALDFDGSGSHGHDLIHTLHGLSVEFILRRRM